MRTVTDIGTTTRIELSRYKRLREQLLTEIPGLDEETLADTLEGITDLPEMLAELVRSVLEDEALSGGLSARVTDMRSRLERFKTRAEKKRALVLMAMSDAEIKSLVAPDFTASLRQGPPVAEIIAEEEIPSAYWKPQPPKLDRLSLLAALKDGQQVKGAALAEPQSHLSVRTK